MFTAAISSNTSSQAVADFTLLFQHGIKEEEKAIFLYVFQLIKKKKKKHETNFYIIISLP